MNFNKKVVQLKKINKYFKKRQHRIFFKYYYKYKKRIKFLKVNKPDSFLYIKLTFNNVLFTFKNINKKKRKLQTNFWLNNGCLLNIKKSLRSTFYATQQTARAVGFKIKKKNFNKINIYFHGIGRTKKAILRGLNKAKLKFCLIKDLTSIPHNGCRTKKLRRK